MALALRSEEWTSVHDCAMTRACGQTDPAPALTGPGVVTGWPPCGSAWHDLPARQACSIHQHLPATR